MNQQIIKDYIADYKREFGRINREEIYKWKAIKHFQEHFDLEAPNLSANLDTSLHEAKNLLVSGNYFPNAVLVKNAAIAPERVREMFRILFDEDFDLKARIESFRADFKVLNRENYGEDNDYQDHRAIIVYLVLRYPERYFLYKFGMFKEFARIADYPYQPKQGKIENIGQFNNLCDFVKEQIENDQELLTMHARRLDESCHRDRELNVLTQDFIYAVVKHLKGPIPEGRVNGLPTATSLKLQKAGELKLKSAPPTFRGALINHNQNDIENKRIGDAGELWAVKYEEEYLKSIGRSDLAKKVKHVAKSEGDGLGYDILSFSPNGNTKYIEVKTTKGDFHSTFYITRNELEWSKLHPGKYCLYRLYHFKDSISSADLTIIKGDLSSICLMPLSFKVNLES
jgi:hypothetical protein